MENHTARHFVLQLGSLISLYLSLSFLLVLLFALINLGFPDAADSIWQVDGFSDSVRIGIAMVVVFFPTYLTLTRLVNNDRRRNPEGNYLGLTKWLIYLSLLVGGAVLLGDLVAVIMSFLEGDLTQRFLLKAMSVVVVVGAAFGYYLKDVKGYWLKKEQRSVGLGIVTAVVVFIVVAYGFAFIEAPSEVREQKIDATQVQDLQSIQYRIEGYLRANEVLPTKLDDLTKSTGVAVPVSPENRSHYQYMVTEDGFKLCASFAFPSSKQKYPDFNQPISLPYEFNPSPVYETVDGKLVEIKQPSVPRISKPVSWEHGEGDVCFESRVVNNK